MLFLLSLSTAFALPKLPGALDKFLVSATQQEYNQNCAPTLQTLDELEAQHGKVTKENIQEYSSAYLALGYVLGACANIQSEFGSDLQKEQEAAVKRMYDVFIQQHLVIDQFGNGSSYDSTAQNLFTKASPLDEAHFLCKPERTDIVDEFIAKSWFTSELKTLEESIRGVTPLVNFENELAGVYDEYVAIAKEKSNACLANKLDIVRAYENAAPESVQKEWESAIRQAVKDNADVKIARIVYPYANFKRITEDKREILSDGTIRVIRNDYEVMDAYVYVINGEFVDGYVVSLYKDHVQNAEYARFYGLDANGQLRPSQRLLSKNF